MDLGIHIDSFGSLRAPVPSLLISLVMYVELEQEGLDITLVLDCQKASLEILSKGHIIFSNSLAWWLIASCTA